MLCDIWGCQVLVLGLATLEASTQRLCSGVLSAHGHTRMENSKPLHQNHNLERALPGGRVRLFRIEHRISSNRKQACISISPQVVPGYNQAQTHLHVQGCRAAEQQSSKIVTAETLRLCSFWKLPRGRQVKPQRSCLSVVIRVPGLGARCSITDDTFQTGQDRPKTKWRS